MPVTSGGIRVHRDHVVSAVHAFREFDGHVPDAFKVGLRGHVELVRVERQNVALKLVRSAMSSGVRLSTRDELRRSRPAVDLDIAYAAARVDPTLRSSLRTSGSRP